MGSMRKIILASTSPRRQDILERVGLKFVVEPSDYEEDMSLKMPPRELAKFLSRGKAEAVAKKHKDAIVIGADTFVVLGKELMGKAHTPAQAKSMLRKLSGKKHCVLTGLTIIDTKKKKSISRVSESFVYFKKLSTKEIDAYVGSGEAFGKAAAYAIQGRAAAFIRKTEGDFWGIVGLPVYELVWILKRLGVDFP
jgi:septum formation protein